MELEDNRIGDVIERGSCRYTWSLFSGVNYIIGGFNFVILGEMM